MKTTLTLALLALAPALLAQEPTNSSPARLTQDSPSAQEDLAEHAALVQQIGEDAARGFDAEAHAHALRLQIETLVSKSPLAKSSPVPAATVTSVPVSKPATLPAAVEHAPADSPRPVETRETGLREAVQKLRAALDQLEAQLKLR